MLGDINPKLKVCFNNTYVFRITRLKFVMRMPPAQTQMGLTCVPVMKVLKVCYQF